MADLCPTASRFVREHAFVIRFAKASGFEIHDEGFGGEVGTLESESSVASIAAAIGEKRAGCAICRSEGREGVTKTGGTIGKGMVPASEGE